MTSSDPAVQRSLASGSCAPKIYREGFFCHLSPICGRCRRCIGHCTCAANAPPAKSKKKAAK